MFFQRSFFAVSLTAVIFVQCNVSNALPAHADNGQDYISPNHELEADKSKYPVFQEEGLENQKLHNLLKQQSSSFDPTSIPDFYEIMDTLSELPSDIVNEIKNFLEDIVPRMPQDNPVSSHFSNSLFLLNLFENFVSQMENGIDPQLQDEVQNVLSNAGTEIEDLKNFVSAAVTHSEDHNITKKALDKTSVQVGTTSEALKNTYKEQPLKKTPKESKLKQSHIEDASITTSV